jgi:hypothetical protein
MDPITFLEPVTFGTSTDHFITGLWSGLAAPVGLYASTPRYPYYVGTSSVAQSFGQVGSYMSYVLGRCRDECDRRPSTAQR